MVLYRIPGPLGREISWDPALDKRLASSKSKKASPKDAKATPVFAPVTPPVDDPSQLNAIRTRTAAPKVDGEINQYVFDDLDLNLRKKYLDSVDKAARDIDLKRRAIFINGMGNSGENNKESSCVLSLLLLCPVISVYNKQGGFVADLMQCLGDKVNFQVWPPKPKNMFEVLARNAKTDGERIRIMANLLRSGRLGNQATAAMFRLLADGRGKKRTIPIYAHSQGNLILSNALQAVKIVLGPGAIQGRKVFSYGSPSINWPNEIEHYDHAFTFDLVSLLNFVPSWSISKVGWPDATANPITHGFSWYLQEDAAFIINRHRVGGLGATFNMNEAALATELVEFGLNEQRLLRVFNRLDSHHNSDADDVALAYVQQIRSGGKSSILKLMPGLVKTLIRVMDEGWTSSEEQEAISFLKGLI